jgi:outer membrane protein assembly factor BamB
VAKLNPGDLSYLEGFGGNDFFGFSQPGVALLYPVGDWVPSYAYALAVDDAGAYVGGYGGTQGFLAVLDPATGQERERLVLGSTDSQAKTHVEAVPVKDGTLYVAGHTNVPFDCDGNPTGPVAQSAMAFVLKLSASDLTCDGGFGSGGVAILQTPGDTEILSLALSQDGTHLLATGFGGESLAEGDTSVAFKGLARLWVLEPRTGQTVASFPDINDYPYPISSHCQVDPGTYEQNITCADRAAASA